MDALTQYKRALQEQLESADLLIAKLVHENTVLSQTVETRTKENQGLQERLQSVEETGREYRNCEGFIRALVRRKSTQIV